ncbi:MAG: tyrosine-type recombinase/integrase [Granulosicoccus sp.]
MKDHATTTAIDQCIAEFLAHKRTLGRDYKSEEFILGGLRRFLLRDNSGLDLDQPTFDRWCRHMSELCANTRRSRQLVVHKLCLFRRRTQADCFVPNPLYFTRSQPYLSPVLIEPEQVAVLLERAKNLTPTKNSPLLGPVFRLAIVLLYTAGLRRGELVAMTLGDVDVENGALRIRESKFHKSRLVPLSASARFELRRYLVVRKRGNAPQNADSALLCNYKNGSWRPYTGTGMGQGIGRLLAAADVQDSYGRRPRVHDFRHSFAVQALIRLYRNGLDVQSALPYLALYMGHVSIVSTAHYLHLVPTLAALASERFENLCAGVLEGACHE